MMSCEHDFGRILPRNPFTDLKAILEVLRNVVHPRSGSLEGTFAEAAPETIRIRWEPVFSLRPCIWRLKPFLGVVIRGGEMLPYDVLLETILAIEHSRALVLRQADLDIVLVEMIHVMDSIRAEDALHTRHD
jgi:hypothetical protein